MESSREPGIACIEDQQRLALEAQRLADEVAVKRQILATLSTAVETRDPKTLHMMVNLVESQSRFQGLLWPSGALQLNSTAALNSTATDDAPAVQ